MTHGDSSRAWQCLLSFLSFFFLCHGLETVFIASVSPQTGTRLQFLAEGQSLFSLLQAQFILDSGGLASGNLAIGEEKAASELESSV